jgi:hypothetical protein
MKRAIVAALFVVSLAACGDNSKPQADKGTPAPEATKELSAPVAEKSAPEASARTPSPAAAKVFLILPEDGATVHSPVALKFGVEGMDIVPAGTDEPHSGHHHLLIDTKLDDYNAPIPADETHRHYGLGQTEAAVGLAPGKHTLQLILGDKNHIPHDPPVESQAITINVE